MKRVKALESVYLTLHIDADLIEPHFNAALVLYQMDLRKEASPHFRRGKVRSLKRVEGESGMVSDLLEIISRPRASSEWRDPGICADGWLKVGKSWNGSAISDCN